MKKFIDDQGEYWLDEQEIGTETGIDCIVDIKPECTAAMIQSALTVSPKEACVKHLTHLSLHKKFGSTDQDRAVLLNDYVRGLCGYPEFVLQQVCKHYWESDRRPFVPYIGEIKQSCDIFVEVLQRHIRNLDRRHLQITQVKKELVHEEWKPPSEADKANVHDIVQQCIRNLSA